MSGQFPNLLAVVADDKGGLHLVSSLVGTDDFLGGARRGDRIVAASHDRTATGLVRRLAESDEKVFAFYGDKDGKDVMNVFEEVVLSLVNQAYLAGKERILG